MNEYRFDNRDQDQFKKDIEECTAIEQTLMSIYVDWLNKRREKRSGKYSFTNYGVDNSGQFIEANKDVNTKADFLLKRKGKADRKIEIKFCRPFRKAFHLKVNQMMKYVEEDVCIVNFMAIDTNEPKFCILPPSALAQWLDCGERVEFKPWGWKECIKFYDVDMDWHYYDKK